MTRVTTSIPVVNATTKLDLSSDPTVKGKAGAVAWYRDVMGLTSVGIGLVTKATNDKTLPSYKISGAIWYSTVDLYNFIQGMRRTADSRPTSGPVWAQRMQ